jgi:hypothetical protein
MLPDDRASGQLWPVSPNGSASSWMVCSETSSRLRRRVEPATAIAGTLTQLSGIASPTTRKSRPRSVRNHQHAVAGGLDDAPAGEAHASSAVRGRRGVRLITDPDGHKLSFAWPLRRV